MAQNNRAQNYLGGPKSSTKPEHSKRFLFAKERMQFSKRLALTTLYFSMFIVLGTILLNFALLWFDKTPMPEETITTITTFGIVVTTGASISYGGLQLGRDLSKNKHKVTHKELDLANGIGAEPENTDES